MKSIGLVTVPIGKASLTPVSNMVEIVSTIFEELYFITGGQGPSIHNNRRIKKICVVDALIGSGKGFRVINGLISILKTTAYTGYYSRKVNLWIFPMGADVLLPAIVIAKVIGTPIIVNLPSSPQAIIEEEPRKLKKIFIACAKTNFLLADRIVIYSPRLITEWNLEKYRRKTLIAHRHFLDFNTFTVTIPLPDRPPLVGYIGRLSGEKGIQNFAQALPAILSDQQDLRVLIGGDGQLKEAIEASLQEQGVSASVDLPGWISHDDLPKYLNQLRLLVLPSYTEGLPNIMLEAMACGTPVLATPVGAIPDVIIDGKTGFIMESNSPECIAENVRRALDSPDLEQIAEAGRRFVGENYTFERVVERWKEVLEEI